MKIETRFGIGNIVFFMLENQPRASRVQGVAIYIDANEEVNVKYQLEGLGRSFKEEELAETRDKLKEKVFGR